MPNSAMHEQLPVAQPRDSEVCLQASESLYIESRHVKRKPVLETNCMEQSGIF